MTCFAVLPTGVTLNLFQGLTTADPEGIEMLKQVQHDGFSTGTAL